MRLQDKVTLITGAGSGIGRSTALLFASEGAAVIVNDVDEAKGRETVSEIIEKGGVALFIQADVTQPEAVKSMVEAAIAEFGRIDVLFNNAGISGIGALHEIEPDTWDRIMSINVKGVFLPS
ncbi:SDR family NAD(P)-dependent oxidoreductase, partial [Paenibacillus sp. GCM10027629]|uniref:SDR family NAD(P)-dependent oxidoreductase n=1 Tax=Paenibacillus sp. GCM10027629 TaxID=3273414 RepID=UPI0036275338